VFRIIIHRLQKGIVLATDCFKLPCQTQSMPAAIFIAFAQKLPFWQVLGISIPQFLMNDK